MSLIRNDDVLFYHPLDSDTEYTQSYDWTRNAWGIFDTGVISSGFTQSGSASFCSTTGSKAGGGYDDLEGHDHFTVAFWSSGLRNGPPPYQIDRVQIGFSVGNNQETRNGLNFYSSHPSYETAIVGLKIRGNNVWKELPSFPTTAEWHLTIVDFSLQGSTWRYLVSIDGSGWQNIGSGGTSTLPDSTTVGLIHIDLQSVSPGDISNLDEVVVWAGHDQFTENELSNLYELVNTYNSPMNLYSSTFGTPVNSGINCFIHGYIQTSGDLSLYIPGQKETKSADLLIDGHIPTSGDISLYISGTPTIASSSITLYTLAPSPASSGMDLYITGPLSESGNIDNFIYGYQTLSDNVDQYINGYSSISGNISLYISGVPWESSSIILYTVGPLPSSGNIDNFIWGHLPSSGSCPLFTKGLFPTFDAFVSTVENNPSNSVDLFTHGVPSGVSTVFYTNDSITLFIEDSGDIPTVDVSWPSFARVDDAITTGESGTWSVFVKGGNADNNNISMYTYGHASGEAPHGTLVTGSGDLFIDGLSLQDGEEGLLSDGYSIADAETAAFAKVHLGLNNSANMYISGEIIPVPPSSSIDLYTFGILDTESGSCTAYTLGLASASGQANLFLFGIQDVAFNNIPLYIKVTDIGLYDKTANLYSHGY